MKLKTFFFNVKPIIVETIYCSPSQNSLLELLNSNTNEINSVGNEICILAHCNIILFSNDSYVLEKIIESQFQVMLGAIMNL